MGVRRRYSDEKKLNSRAFLTFIILAELCRRF